MSNPIVIVGTTHSGSTILYRLLAYHPDLAWFSQFSLRDGLLPGRRGIPLSSLYDVYARKIHRHPWSKDTHTSILGKILLKVLPAPNSIHGLWKDYAFPDLDNRTYHRSDSAIVKDRVVSLVDRALIDQKKSRFLTKGHSIINALPAMVEIFPQVCFIHIVRDGKAVAVSPIPTYPRGSKEALEIVKNRASYWRTTVERIQEIESEIGAGRVCTVRYEDLCRDVHGTILSVLNWCNLAKPEKILKWIPDSIRITNHRRIAATPENERESISGVLKDVLPLYGYGDYS